MLNDFGDIDIHEMIERFDLVGDDLPPLRLFEIQIKHMSVGGEHCTYRVCKCFTNFTGLCHT